MKNSKDFSGSAWSSDEFSEYRYELTIDKERAERITAIGRVAMDDSRCCVSFLSD